MSVRTGIALASIVVLGMFGVACSGPARPTEPSLPPSSTVQPPDVQSPDVQTPELSPTPTSTPAEEPGASWLRVSPQQGAPGSTVTLDVACLDNLGVVHSPVLDIGALRGNPEGHQPWRLFGTATVRSNAVAGQYQISTTCGANELSTGFTVMTPPSR
ncbi:MAG: hypothetical protein M3Y48_12865 [Actinomycetota bacterium]|nr:hypothetical protein [Actinomycetota bacterium]